MTDFGWWMAKLLNIVGLTLAVAGFGIFSWNFLRTMTEAARTDPGQVPANAWRGATVRFSLGFLATGVVIKITAALLRGILPQRP